MSRSPLRPRRLVVATLCCVVAATSTTTAGATGATRRATATPPALSARCPWVEQSRHHRATPSALADEVLSRMTLREKASFVVLATRPPLENLNVAVPSLCVPSLSLSDGPDGVSGGLTGVTQFPAAIGVAASFDPSLARAVGSVIGAEARVKGIMDMQATELNLARVPLSGRTFESYGEDPYLAGILGVANIEGIQSRGVMDTVKHLGAYTQETARVRLNQLVSARALAEVYDAPFRAAVEQAHVASVMCAYGRLNGVNTCSDPVVYATLKSWGFTGFVRSDLDAVQNVTRAFEAGIALVKPASPTGIVRFVQRGVLPVQDLNRAVRVVLAEMFRFGLIGRVPSGSPYASATTPSHVAVALRAAEESIVLLKNAGGLLPLTGAARTVAVVGTSGAVKPLVTGGGSSMVQSANVVTPLGAIRATLANSMVSYTLGGPSQSDMDRLNDVDIVRGTPLKLITRTKQPGEPGKADVAVDLSPNVTDALATATTPGRGEGWYRWRLVVRARKTGLYQVSFEGVGDTWLRMNGSLILDSPGLHARDIVSTTVALKAGHRYLFSATWFAVRHHPLPSFGIVDVTPAINTAVAAARKARVAIVYAGDYSAEGVDRANLNLPGDANALISAVAAVNPRTIVVLNTGGAVAMPWLSRVAAVLEAWYPGQEDGAAISAVLTGRFDPSGRLPITFPTSMTAMPAASTRSFPGVDSTVNFSGLDVGYRWYQAHHVRPLFAFGYGLSYTTFALADASVTKTATGVVVRVDVRNVGPVQGTDVVQAYVHYPSSTGEPTEQLRAFARVALAPGATRTLAMAIPSSGFQVFRNGLFTTVPGLYGVDVGQSSNDLTLRATITLR